MTKIQFKYWLRGFFELVSVGADVAPAINEQQVELIKSHLTLASSDNTVDSFYSWLNGAMLFCGSTWTSQTATIISDKLTGEFINVAGLKFPQFPNYTPIVNDLTNIPHPYTPGTTIIC